MTNKAPIFDSQMILKEAIAGTTAPKDILAFLCLVDVRYFSFDGCLHQGQLVLHKDVRKDIIEIFALIEKWRFPIGKAVPIVKYNWSDKASMADNNSSAFNYRFVAESKRLSNHAYGRAIDINPRQNPIIYEGGIIEPEGSAYFPGKEGSLYHSGPVVNEFLKRNWQWGGQFEESKDYHHFDKPADAT